MRTIQTEDIALRLEEMILSAQYDTPQDLSRSLDDALSGERSHLGQAALKQIIESRAISHAQRLAICQDTGLCVVFADIGQDVHLAGAYFEDAVNGAVRRAYEGLRKSAVRDPLFDRQNTRDNTPAVIHARIVPGDRLRLLVICKGFGSENKSRIGMLSPSDGVQGVRDFIVETARLAGASACPPLILGACVGGSFEQAALWAKRMTAQPLDRPNPDPRYAALERETLDAINALGIGPAGFGGVCTALKVSICALPTHIAGLPVAVNVCCHASRHAEAEL